jgi:hypothetical protein
MRGRTGGSAGRKAGDANSLNASPTAAGAPSAGAPANAVRLLSRLPPLVRTFVQFSLIILLHELITPSLHGLVRLRSPELIATLCDHAQGNLKFRLTALVK